MKAKKNKIYEQEYAQFQESFEEAQGVEIAVLEETEKKELKSLYNKGVQLCHPDKYTSEEEKKLAHDWFVALNDANQKNDLVRVREILNNLETGNFLHRKITIYTNVEELEKQLEYLKEEREKLNQEIQTLCQDIPLSIIEDEALWDNYFENQETLLKTQLAQYQ